MSETMDAIVTAIVENRRRFEAFCYSLSEDELNRPVPNSTWIVRDFASHLDTLDRAIIGWLRALAADGESLDATRNADGSAFDVDAFNDEHVAERRAWPTSRVFEEAEQNRRELIDGLRALTDEQVERPMHFAGDAKRRPGDLPLKTFLVGWAQHDPIHVADMLRALPERVNDVELRKWLDNPFVAGYQAIMNRAGV
ncbi:MAG: maleylpyruvate isomerase N-terminal domain-containing protein [Dehalococcoidia bacterium]